MQAYFPIDQFNRSVEFVFRDKSTFNMTFTVDDTSGGISSASSRNIVFAGRSSLSLCPDPTPEPTLAPSLSLNPSSVPTSVPTFEPSLSPTVTPEPTQTFEPTTSPTLSPSFLPTISVPPSLTPPTQAPSNLPVEFPSVSFQDADNISAISEQDQFESFSIAWTIVLPCGALSCCLLMLVLHRLRTRRKARKVSPVTDPKLEVSTSSTSQPSSVLPHDEEIAKDIHPMHDAECNLSNGDITNLYDPQEKEFQSKGREVHNDSRPTDAYPDMTARIDEDGLNDLEQGKNGPSQFVDVRSDLTASERERVCIASSVDENRDHERTSEHNRADNGIDFKWRGRTKAGMRDNITSRDQDSNDDDEHSTMEHQGDVGKAFQRRGRTKAGMTDSNPTSRDQDSYDDENSTMEHQANVGTDFQRRGRTKAGISGSVAGYQDSNDEEDHTKHHHGGVGKDFQHVKRGLGGTQSSSHSIKHLEHGKYKFSPSRADVGKDFTRVHRGQSDRSGNVPETRNPGEEKSTQHHCVDIGTDFRLVHRENSRENGVHNEEKAGEGEPDSSAALISPAEIEVGTSSLIRVFRRFAAVFKRFIQSSCGGNGSAQEPAQDSSKKRSKEASPQKFPVEEKKKHDESNVPEDRKLLDNDVGSDFTRLPVGAALPSVPINTDDKDKDKVKTEEERLKTHDDNVGKDFLKVHQGSSAFDAHGKNDGQNRIQDEDATRETFPPRDNNVGKDFDKVYRNTSETPMQNAEDAQQNPQIKVRRKGRKVKPKKQLQTLEDGAEGTARSVVDRVEVGSDFKKVNPNKISLKPIATKHHPEAPAKFVPKQDTGVADEYVRPTISYGPGDLFAKRSALTKAQLVPLSGALPIQNLVPLSVEKSNIVVKDTEADSEATVAPLNRLNPTTKLMRSNGVLEHAWLKVVERVDLIGIHETFLEIDTSRFGIIDQVSFDYFLTLVDLAHCFCPQVTSTFLC